MLSWFRSCMQFTHQQQWRVATEEPGRVLHPHVLPGPCRALLQLFSGLLRHLASAAFTFVNFLLHYCKQLCVFAYMQMEALPQLTVRQLAEVSATPGQLTSSDQVTMVMKHVQDQHFSSFFDDLSVAISVSIYYSSSHRCKL